MMAMTLAACLSFPAAVNAAESPRDPSAVIASLGNRIYSLAETTGKTDDMVAAETEAANEIRRYIANGLTKGLLAKEKGKGSPLALAAYLGYPNVVDALLTSDSVRRHVNDVDEMGMTPWIASTLSLRQSMPACNPQIAENVLALVPIIVTQPYYVSNPVAPYRKTRELLAQAGASADMSKAKEIWFGVCKNQSTDGKKKVRDSTDMQKTVQELGMAELSAQLSNLQKKMGSGSGK